MATAGSSRSTLRDRTTGERGDAARRRAVRDDRRRSRAPTGCRTRSAARRARASCSPGRRRRGGAWPLERAPQPYETTVPGSVRRRRRALRVGEAGGVGGRRGLGRRLAGAPVPRGGRPMAEPERRGSSRVRRGTRASPRGRAAARRWLGCCCCCAVRELDVTWEHHPSHFWLVLATAAAERRAGLRAPARPRSAAVTPGCCWCRWPSSSSAGFLGLHALATPGVLLDDAQPGLRRGDAGRAGPRLGVRGAGPALDLSRRPGRADGAPRPVAPDRAAGRDGAVGGAVPRAAAAAATGAARAGRADCWR